MIRDGYYGVLVCTRPDVDEVLQHPQIFSSGMGAAPLGNVRPLIPLQIDPPRSRNSARSWTRYSHRSAWHR